MSNAYKLLIILVSGFFLAACASKPPAEGTGDIVAEPVEGTAGANSTGLDGEDSGSGSGLDGDSADILSQRIIYFDYDSSSLTDESTAVVQAHANHLVESPEVDIILEGHADERGTREYNLALGEERAKSVADLLQALGVGDGRIQTISYGEERPASLGSDESAWGLNRRVELLY
ncbi:MAG: peptidoglycan-associated lipoprotein Pal [Gammaproteobacteria bacterium]|nr:peptidoglycan-associated lipoprotein Pal [Gammaproteobacteria bacterium]